MIYKNLNENIEKARLLLPVAESYDILEKKYKIGGKDACFYFVDGFVKGSVMQRIMDFLYRINPVTMSGYKNAQDFIDHQFPYVEVETTNKWKDVIKELLSGKSILFIDGYEDAIFIDLRSYPSRNTEEPDKEKTLRGSKDGFVETLITNTALVRRRIRDPKLIFKIKELGERSKLDVAVGYIDDLVDREMLRIIEDKIDNLKIQSITMAQQGLVEAITNSNILNPYPKVRYTERPDVAAASILEGKIVIFVDNSPLAIILPTSVFDFIQEAEDFYFPPVVGGYLRIVRNIFFISSFFIIPVWLFFINNENLIPEWLEVIKITEKSTIPLIIQILLLEFAIDGLKIASVNTPSSLVSSFSIIGALLLGEFAVKTGWFSPDTILYMAIVALANFAQPSVELGYALKFMRIITTILTQFFGIYGLIGGTIFVVVLLCTTRAINNKGYLYPLIPFNKKALAMVLLRKRIKADKK
ncbi:MAG: spore germination protein [Ruminococcaceae bacterium]|nr:spore germination protein [Oscillospiraceae bacterium]